MTDRIKTLVVTLDHEYRDDSDTVKRITELMLGIQSVKAVQRQVHDSFSYQSGRDDADREWREKVISLLQRGE